MGIEYWVEIQVCDTCAVVIANGDTSGDGGAKSAEALEKRWPGYYLFLSCTAECDHGFFLAPCGVCGAEGGALHDAIAEPRTPEGR